MNNYYQARISIETARLLEKMRLIYEDKVGGNVTKGDCLIRAFENSKWTDRYDYNEIWKKIHSTPMPILDGMKYEISPTSQILKIQITDDVKDEIQKLKKRLPLIIGTRSVTVGVCIRELLKAAYIKENNYYLEESDSVDLSTTLNLSPKDILDGNDKSKIIDLLESTQEQINLLFDHLKNELSNFE